MRKITIAILAIVMIVTMCPVISFAGTPTAAPSITKVVQTDDVIQVQFEADENDFSNNRHFVLEGRVSGGAWEELNKTDVYNYATRSFNSEKGKWGGITFESGKTYEFRGCYMSSDGNKGTYSAVKTIVFAGSGSGGTDNEKLANTKVTTSTSGGYSNKKDVTAGMTKVFQNDAFKLTVKVSKVTATQSANKRTVKVTYQFTLIPKITDYMTFYAYDNNKTTPFNDAGYIVWKNDGKSYYSYDQFKKGTTYKSTVTRTYTDCGKKYIYLDAHFVHGAVEKSLYFDYAIAPGVHKPTLKTNVEAKKSSITFKNLSRESGVTLKVFYRKKGASSWKTKIVSKNSVTIKSLKANTTYQFRFQTSKKAKDRNGTSSTLASPKTSTLSVKTGLSKAPVVKSITAKTTKYSKTHTDGYWDSVGIWHNGYDQYYTTFKVTVNLKGKVSGAKSLIVNVGGEVYKVKNAKTVTFTAKVKGDQRGKKVSIKVASCTNSYHIGQSPYSSVRKVTVKK